MHTDADWLFMWISEMEKWEPKSKFIFLFSGFKNQKEFGGNAGGGSIAVVQSSAAPAVL